MGIEDKINRLNRDLYISEVMVGPCPKCGSSNTHDCEAPEFILDPQHKSITKIGSECPVAREINDITIGHCDDCDYLWCLECGSELSIDHPICGHWAICDDCGKTYEIPDTCPYDEEDLLINPCPDCQNISECSKCPYTNEVYRCPIIVKWKQQLNP